MPDVIKSSTTCASSQLREFRSLQQLVMFSGVLRQFLNNHCARWHVDAYCESLCCKYNLDKALNEAFLYSFFEHGNHAGMVAGNTTRNIVNEMVIFKRVFIVSGEILAMTFNDLADLYFLFERCQHHSCVHARMNSVFALSSAEDEDNGRQH